MACREIKFRGLDANGVLRYGRLSQDEPDSTVYYAEYSQRICWLKGKSHCNIPVSNKTLGQYTGLNDKNGVEIYEGDIIDIPGIVPMIVGFYNGCFVEGNISPSKPLYMRIDDYKLFGKPEVIGNIMENKELLDV